MDKELIVVRQLPIIEDQLRQIKSKVEDRVNEVLSMACTEETRLVVKSARTSLNREFGELETRRKEVKASIMAPYEEFEALYKECVGDIYKDADAKLKARIGEVEDGLRQQKIDEVAAYFEEYRESLGIEADFVTFSDSGIKATLSDSKKALKAKAKDFLDRIAGDLDIINVQEHNDEILVEYKRTLNLSQAITTVDQRLKAIEAQRQRREAAANQAAAREEGERKVEALVAEDAPVLPPTPIQQTTPVEEPVLYSTAFKVTGTIADLKALKNFLTEGGYIYEQL
jgi:hypothetical protein